MNNNENTVIGGDRTHTPGPWQTDGRWISASDFRPGTLFLADCSVSSGYRSQEETQANAQLMAVAPELKHELGAIHDALEAGETVIIEPGSVKAKRISTTLAKAEGKARAKLTKLPVGLAEENWRSAEAHLRS